MCCVGALRCSMAIATSVVILWAFAVGGKGVDHGRIPDGIVMLHQEPVKYRYPQDLPDRYFAADSMRDNQNTDVSTGGGLVITPEAAMADGGTRAPIVVTRFILAF